MQLPDPHIHFVASLSDGQTIIEGKGDWQWFPDGRPSPWNRLVRYTAEQGLAITSLSLVAPDGQIYNFPPAGKKAKFEGYADRVSADKPLDYTVRRHIAHEISGVGRQVTNIKAVEFYTIAVAIYPTFELQLWVDENDHRKSWTVVKHIQ
jgi:hypothetical protein